jgi:putative transposase
MTSNTTKPELTQPEPETEAHLFDNWFDPIETGLRDRVREFIQAMFEGELEAALSRPRYARCAKPLSGDGEDAVCVSGHRHGHRSRSLLGSFGQLEIEVPRARLNTADGKTTEWGCVERSLAGRRTDRAAHSRRYVGARTARS